jgi:hypothetical protein
MPFFVNHTILDLNTVKLPNGDFYVGTDEIKMKFAEAWKELEKRFWNKGEDVIFVTPGIKSGSGKGNQGYWAPRVVNVNTKKGSVRIAWADDMKVEGGQTVYTPISFRIGVNEKVLTCTKDDLEVALFMFMFNNEVISETRPQGRTYLQDFEAEAKKYEETETNAAIISYWLFRKESPFYMDEVRISTLCLAWGVNPENKSNTYRKQLLAEAVKKNDRLKNPEFDMKAFDTICRKLSEGQDIRDVEIMSLIQKCIIRKVIRYDDQKFAWVFLGMDGNILKTICKVPPQNVSKNRDLLKKHLIGNPDDVETLLASIGGEPTPSRFDEVALTKALPEDVTREYIEKDMGWTDMKKIYVFITQENTTGMAKEQIIPRLIEFFVVQKKTIPWRLKESS